MEQGMRCPSGAGQSGDILKSSPPAGQATIMAGSSSVGHAGDTTPPLPTPPSSGSSSGSSRSSSPQTPTMRAPRSPLSDNTCDPEPHMPHAALLQTQRTVIVVCHFWAGLG